MQSQPITRRRTYVERICTRCDAPYTTRSDTKQRFCSMTCSTSTKAPRTCERCEGSFSVRLASRQRFCNAQCRRGTDEQRFLAHFTQSAKSECWLWTGYLSGNYGRMRWCGEMTLAHRISWMHFVGPIPDGLLVLHKCPGGGNPRCVNPSHLGVGDYVENADDMMRDGRHWSATGVWSPPPGERSAGAVLTEAMVSEARLRVRGGERCKDIAAEWRVVKGTLPCAVSGRSWRHLTNPAPVRLKRGGGVYAA